MPSFSAWLKKTLGGKNAGPKRVFGYLVISDSNEIFVRYGDTTGWGGKLEPETLDLYKDSIIAVKDLKAIRKLTTSWERKPAKVYAVIFDRETEKVIITGGPFDFWQMALMRTPPDSPVGPGPKERPQGFFTIGSQVWFYDDYFWRKGTIVNCIDCGVFPPDIFIACSGDVVKISANKDIIWPYQKQ